jgi:hypothetical protein
MQNRNTTRILITAGCCAVIGAPALAQDQPLPVRNGNIWDSRAHQPDQGSVRANEQRAGIAPSESQARSEDQELQQMGQLIIERARRGAQGMGNQTGTGGEGGANSQ